MVYDVIGRKVEPDGDNENCQIITIKKKEWKTSGREERNEERMGNPINDFPLVWASGGCILVYGCLVFSRRSWIIMGGKGRPLTNGIWFKTPSVSPLILKNSTNTCCHMGQIPPSQIPYPLTTPRNLSSHSSQNTNYKISQINLFTISIINLLIIILTFNRFR